MRSTFLALAFAVAPAASFSTVGAVRALARGARGSRQPPAVCSVSVFIDGEAGTTGLQVRGRLEKRDDVELISLPEAERKDAAARAKAINDADAVILCLPDEAAIEAAALVAPDNKKTVLIDASTAHRTDSAWTYGFPELTSAQRTKLATSKRIANPGCYATGFIALARPLVDAGLLRKSSKLVASAISGYSGGGKALMGVYEDGPHEPWGAYAFNLDHKHLPEMKYYSQLKSPPIFLPAVGDFAQGMVVSVPIHYERDLRILARWRHRGRVGEAVHRALSDHYASDTFVTVMPLGSEAWVTDKLLERDAFLRPDTLKDTNHLQIFVYANEEKRTCVVAARLDNLGKGASGAAVQNLNIALGLDEKTGL